MPDRQVVMYCKLGRGGIPVACYGERAANAPLRVVLASHKSHTQRGCTVSTIYDSTRGRFKTTVTEDRHRDYIVAYATDRFLDACAKHVDTAFGPNYVAASRASAGVQAYFRDTARAAEAATSPGANWNFTLIATRARPLTTKNVSLRTARNLWVALLAGVLAPDEFAQRIIDARNVFIAAAAHAALSHERRPPGIPLCENAAFLAPMEDGAPRFADMQFLGSAPVPAPVSRPSCVGVYTSLPGEDE